MRDNYNDKLKLYPVVISIVIFIVSNVLFDFIFYFWVNLNENLEALLSVAPSLLISVLYLEAVAPIIKKINHLKKEEYILGLFGGILFAVIIFPYYLISGSSEGVPIVCLGNGKFNGFIYLILLAVVIPILEEYIFRGQFYRIIRDNYNIWVGLIVSTLIFSVYHWDLYTPLFLSIITTFAYELSSSVLVCIIIHSIGNFAWYFGVCLLK